MNAKNFISIFSGIFIFLGLLWGFFIIKNSEKFFFRTIKITVVQKKHVDLTIIKKEILENLHGGFFSVDVNHLRQALLSLPWIYEVSLQRIWPNQLWINVYEQQAVARWGQDALLNAQGEIFKPPLASIPDHLPLLTGPPNSQRELLQGMKEMNQFISPLGLHITALNLSARHAWRLILNNHIEVMLGREAINQRMKHFVKLYPQVIGDKQENVERVDLRYPNGIAILWKNNT